LIQPWQIPLISVAKQKARRRRRGGGGRTNHKRVPLRSWVSEIALALQGCFALFATLADETFIVIDGVLRIDFRDGAVHVMAGEMFVVPKGVEHEPCAEHEVKPLPIEPLRGRWHESDPNPELGRGRERSEPVRPAPPCRSP
jgi:mannose-6-phosphate isomerase-like protein (cupin superfamily)